MTDLTTAPVASDVESGDITMLVRTVNGVDTLYQVPASVIQGQTGPTGNTGPIGPVGPQGTRGSTWFFGTTTPSTSLSPIDDDMYYNTTTGDVYNYSSSRWTVIGNIKGPTGARGTAGTTWYFGKGIPLITTASSGDVYLDESTGNLFQYSGSAWAQTTANIIGPTGIDGPTGPQGTRGSTWFTGSGSPTISTALDNDMYLDTSTSNVYQYNNSTWTKTGNIKGNTGSIGSQWYSGNGVPSSSSNYVVNDLYINILTSDVYQYSGSAWTKITNIKGSTGDTGSQGSQGIQGIQGSIWHYGNVSPPTITDVDNTDMYLDGILGNVYQYLSSTWVRAGNIRGANGTFTNDGSDSILIDGLTTFNSGSLKFMSDGDNTTIDSSIVPSGGVSNTPYQGSLDINSLTVTFSGSISLSKNLAVVGSSSLDNGKITTDGSGAMYVATPNSSDNSTRVATTAYVNAQSYLTTSNASSTYLALSGGTMTGSVTFNDNIKINSGKSLYLYSSDNSKDTYIYTNSSGFLTIGSDTSTPTLNVQNIISTGSSSLDNGKITTDGSGTITIKSNVVLTGSNGLLFGSDQTTSMWLSYNTTSSTLIAKGKFSITGSSSLDNGKITTDGSGAMYVATPSTTDNSTRVATTAFVNAQSYLTTSNASSTYLALSGGTMTGSIKMTNGSSNVTLYTDTTTINGGYDLVVENGSALNYYIFNKSGQLSSSLLGNYATQSWVTSNYLSIDGGTLQGNLLVGASEGGKILIGDGDFEQNQGFQVTWNISSGGGETDFLNYRGSGAGGFNFYNGSSSTTSSPTYSLLASIDSLGVFHGTASSAEYADLAEMYSAKEQYESGTFIKISSSDEYDIESAVYGDYVFGVISTKPGFILNSKENGLPVALTGRVPAKIVGSIQKGDPISLSNITGVGTKGTEMILGFALETNLDAGIKIVEIAIGGRS